MKFRKGSINKKAQRRLAHRLTVGQNEAARLLTSKIAESVRSKIPDDDAWMSLYKKALTYVTTKEHDRWLVAGVSPIELTTVPADENQVLISGSSDEALILAAHNPWTVDTLPQIEGGARADVTVLPASPSEAAAHRVRLREVLPDVLSRLSSAGVSASTDGMPEFRGRVVMDLVFLSARLEHGLGGFPRVPAWRKGRAEARSEAAKLVSSPEVLEAIKNGRLEDVDVISDAQRKTLEDFANKRWV